NKEVLTQVGFSAALGQEAGRAAREVGENRDFLVVIQDKLRRPSASFQIEMHAEHARLHGGQAMPATAARIPPQEASGGLGDLVDDGVFGDPPQEPKDRKSVV